MPRVDDVDTAAALTLKTVVRRGCARSSTTARRAVYGYDQRIEVFGSGGMVRAGNPLPTTVERMHGDGATRDKLRHFFTDRYAEAYRIELQHFVDCVVGKAVPLAGAEDSRQALRLADAALESLNIGASVKV